jgi:dienelactone hydrolase
MRRPFHVLSCLIATIVAGCTSMTGKSLSIPSLDIANARKPPHPLVATLALPPGTGPFPVVIVLHGCGGVSPRMDVWAARLNNWGYAAVILDSFGPRGVPTVCAESNQHLVTANDRAGDVLSTAVYLRSLPEIDGSRIGILGQSHGGSTAAWVTQRRYEQQFPGLLRASVDYYGVCRSPETHGTVPLLALAGETDDWGYSARVCRDFASKLHADQPIEVYTYPNTYHAFDDSRTVTATSSGHIMAYNAVSAQDSFQRTHAFLDRYLAPKP